MSIPKDLQFTKDHEWARVENDVATIGITEYAQGELGDIVFVELPEVGDTAKQFEPCANIEAVKAVSDLYAPVSGEIIEVNEALADTPDLVNSDPFGKGWILKVKLSDPAELDKLMTPDAYQELIP